MRGRAAVPSRGIVDFDRDVPLLVARIGAYPIHAGTLGAIRTMGRVGVDAYSMNEDAFTPAARSRYARGLVAPTDGTASEDVLLEAFAATARRIGRRCVVVATDDEAAVFVAEHAGELAEWFVTPDVPPALPRRLTSKRGLHEICTELGVAVPAAAFPTSVEAVDAYAATARFPVVVKNVAAFERLRAPLVGGTKVVADADELRALARTWPPRFTALVQEYLPDDTSEDWIFHGYFDAASRPLVAFTGRKFRSWPPRAGPTTYAVAIENPEVAARACDLCARLGYRGIADLDWRLDRRDGRYKLVDFNPRAGAQFRLFETDAHIDVVRALHLDLTGRPVPPGSSVEGRRFVLEQLDLPARLAYRSTRAGLGARAPRMPRAPVEHAFWARDDPAPFFTMLARFAGPASRRVVELGRERFRGARARRS